MKKWLKGISIGLLIFLGFILATGAWLIWNRDMVKSNAIASLRKETGALFSVKSVGFSMVSFPDFLIRLDSVLVTDSNIAIHKTPVLELGEMELRASLFSLLTGSVAIQSIRFRNGAFRIEKFTDSTDNVLFFNNLAYGKTKKSKANSAKEPFQFNIKSLDWENIIFDFNDSIRQKHIVLNLQKVNQKFSTSDTAIHFTLAGDIMVGMLGLNTDKGTFVSNTLLKTNFVLSWNPGKKELNWTGSKFIARNHPFRVDGNVIATDTAILDLRIQTKGVLEKDVLPLLSEPIALKIGMYEAQGPIDASAIIGGPIIGGEDPKVWIGFEGTNQLFVSHTMEQTFFLKHYKGFYSNQLDGSKPIGDLNSRITLTHIDGIWEDLPFIITGEVANFENPWLVGFIHIPLEQKQMALLSKTFPFNPIQSSGWLKANYDGPIEDLVSASHSYGINYWKGNAYFQVKSGEWKGSNLKFKNVEFNCLIQGDTLQVQKMMGELNGNKVTATGHMKGLAHHIGNPKNAVNIELSVHSNNFNINPLLSAQSQEPEIKSKSWKSGSDPFNFNIQLGLRADKIRFRKLDGKNLTGDFELKNDLLTLRNLKFNTGGGTVLLNSSIKDISGKRKILKSIVSIQKIDVKKLLYGMDQFGQQVFKPENIEGKLDLKGSLGFDLNSAFDLQTESVSADFKMALRSVRLIGFKPLTELSGYLLPKESLENVEIANLNTSFHLKGKNLLVDEFEIPTSLATFYLQGEYDFANHLDMSILVPIHTISRKNHNDVIKRGLKDKSKPGIPLRVYKEDGKVEIGLDSDRAKKRFWKRIKSWTS